MEHNVNIEQHLGKITSLRLAIFSFLIMKNTRLNCNYRPKCIKYIDYTYDHIKFSI